MIKLWMKNRFRCNIIKAVQKILHFIKYHNAFTIIFGIVFFGFGIGFAASPEMRDSVYSSKETVVSVDNSLVVSADLDNFNFNLRINSITEDETNYYAAYSYQTLTIEDGAWQNKEVGKIFEVSKELLNGKDLGLYVAQELGENINAERYYLKRVQELEKEKGESQKVVAIEYMGLIGKLLDPEEKVIEGYNPVIPEATSTPQPLPSPVISDSTVEAPTGIATPSPISTQSPNTTAEITPLISPLLEPNLASSSPTPMPSSEPTPEVSPSPTPEPTPTPTPETTPEATPTPELTPTLTPTPEPTSTPTPESTLEPTPEPVPEE